MKKKEPPSAPAAAFREERSCARGGQEIACGRYSLGHLVEASGQTGLLVRRVVAVNGALGNGLVV